MKIAVAARTSYVEADFFERAGDMWEQLGRAMAAEGQSGVGPLTRVESDAAYSFLMATADRIFSHDLALAFLKRMREWGKERLGAVHASTPQIHVYVKGCHRELALDATRTQWHYLCSLTRGEAARVRLATEDGSPKHRFGISFSRIRSFQLAFNQLLVHETCKAYSLDGPKRAANPLDGAILLHGYLW